VCRIFTVQGSELTRSVDGSSEAQVRLQLKKDEEKEAANGKTPLHGTSATAFLTGGLQIEQAQYVSRVPAPEKYSWIIDVAFLRSSPAWR
jgi:hypothetical protein